MSDGVAKVSLADLARFLRSHGDRWTTSGLPVFDSYVHNDPQSTDGLIESLASYRPDLGYVYVFRGDRDPHATANSVSWSAIPTVDTVGLKDFIIRTVRGADFLWIAPSDEDLSNGQYLEICPAKSQIADETIVSESSSVRREPRLTGISIENFKGIRERVHVPIRPLTLLFGANNAGKSTILHALHYACEIFGRHNLNPDETLFGGNVVKLGGFASFVHRHDLGQNVHLAFDLDLTEAGLPEYLPLRHGYPSLEAEWIDFSDVVTTASVELTISWSHLRGHAYVSGYYIGINDQPFASIMSNPERGRDVHIDFLNDRHPLVHHDPKSLQPDDRWWMDYALANFFDRSPNQTPMLGVYNPKQVDALPIWGDMLDIAGTDSSGSDEVDPYDSETAALLSINFLTQLIVGPGEQLRKLLSRFRYLGPIRDVPTRGYQPPAFHDEGRWASGMAAWDRLIEADEKLIYSVDSWLSDPERLNSGAHLRVKTFVEADLANRAIRGLVTSNALDAESENLDLEGLPIRRKLVISPEERHIELEITDVGVGISQVVPVVVMALTDQERLLAVEQPELHLHPKLQAELGDLLIEAALGKSHHTCLLETHSEHLLLRLLRRVRETAQDTVPPNKAKLTCDQLCVHFVESVAGAVKVTPLSVTEDGDFAGFWPEGFFDERSKELF